jgi:hypothetical protein
LLKPCSTARAETRLVDLAGRNAGQCLGADGSSLAPAFHVEGAGLGRGTLIVAAAEGADEVG